MQTLTQTPSVVKTRLTVTGAIAQVRAYVLERKTAFEVFRFSTHESEKLGACEELLCELQIAELEAKNNEATAVKTMLRCAMRLHYIAPTKTRKLHQTWYLKIEDVMIACREYLGWQKQANK